MQVRMTEHSCVVTREPTDRVLRDGGWGDADSRLLFRLKEHLNRTGGDWIKKRMWKDGHLVDDTQHYIRERKSRNGVQLAVYATDYALRSSADVFNRGEPVCFALVNLEV